MLIDFEDPQAESVVGVDTKATHTAAFFQTENSYLRTKVTSLEAKNKKYMEMLTSHNTTMEAEPVEPVNFGQISRERQAEGDLKEETQ